jgi:hypothetical protein
VIVPLEFVHVIHHMMPSRNGPAKTAASQVYEQIIEGTVDITRNGQLTDHAAELLRLLKVPQKEISAMLAVRAAKTKPIRPLEPQPTPEGEIAKRTDPTQSGPR